MNKINEEDCQQISNNPNEELSVTAMAEIEEVLAELEFVNVPVPAIDLPYSDAASEWKQKRETDKARNAAGGYIAQAYDEIDEYRKTPVGKANRNADRKRQRLAKAEAEGRIIKTRRSRLTDKERADANRDRQAKHRATIPVTKQSADRQRRRENGEKRKEEEAELSKQRYIDQSIF